MRFGSVTLLLAVGIVAVNCGGGGAGGGAPASNTDGSYQAPPATYEPPAVINPTTYEATPSSYDAPPGQTNVGGLGTGDTIGSVWNRLCSEVLGLGCDFSSSSGEEPDANGGAGNLASGENAMATSGACAEAGAALATSVPCPNEYAAALACILDNVTLTCAIFTDAQNQTSPDPSIAANCEAPLAAFAACDASTQPPKQAEPPDLCETPSCTGCPDQCSTCLCQKNDLAKCSICENQ